MEILLLSSQLNNNDDEELENILIAILYQLVNDEFKGKDIIELIMRTQVERIKDKLLPIGRCTYCQCSG